MKKKIFIAAFLVVILIANISLASYSTVTMSVVEEPICTINLANNSTFEKKLISKDLNNKEVTLQLQVTNDEVAEKPTGEIILVIDNSDSMTEPTDTQEIRKDLVYGATQTLISNLLQDNTQLKVGIVSFSTVLNGTEGTIDDASIVCPLTNDVNTLTDAVSNIEANGPRTDLQAGLLLGSRQFSAEDNNKYLITLTDGVPNVAINNTIPYYSDAVITETKEQLLEIEQNNINIITMLTGISNEIGIPTGSTKSYGQIIEEIFGTPASPTAGSFYYISDNEIETTITNNIYNALIPIQQSLKDIVITDYFPEEIINNFDFSYVENANIGDISAQVDRTTNSITWSIPELKSGETATVQYKLKLKENFDSNIVDKILNTNQNVDITYTDTNDLQQSKTSDISPKLRLAEPPQVLPKAGHTILFTFVVISAGLLLFSLAKLTILDRKMK